MKKHIGILALAIVLCLVFIVPASAVKILPYSQPLHDIMHWDAASEKLIIQNPEGENQTISWLSTVDLWNYNGNTWAYDLPTGDKFSFKKEVLFGYSGSAITYTEGEPVVEIWGYNAGTSGSTNAMPLYVHSVLAGTGQVGRAAEFVLAPTARMGAWGNALKAKLDLSGNDGSIGLLAGVCAEIVTPATQLTGSMACVEHEIVATEDLVLADFLYSANTIAFMQFALSGNAGAVTEVDNHGQFFTLNGLTPLAGNLLSANYLTLQCSVGNFQKWIMLSHDENMYSIGTSAAPVPIVAATPKLGVYTDVAAIAAGSLNSVTISQVLDGDCTGTANNEVLQVTLNAQYLSGQWASAIAARIIYDSAGSCTGMSSVINSEMYLTGGATVGGGYYNYESNMIAPSGWTGATHTAFEKYHIGGTDVTSLDDNAVLFHLTGVTPGANDLFYLADLTVTKADGLLKVNIAGVVYYMFITTAINGGD